VKSVGRPDLGGQVVCWGRSLFHTLRERIASLSDDKVSKQAKLREQRTERDETGREVYVHVVERTV
jgi:hypothetical protein